MNALTATRRAALGTIAAAPIAVATGALAFTPTAAAVDRAAWDRAFARYEEASAAASAFDKNVATPVYQTWSIAQSEVPHITTATSFENMSGGRAHFTTASKASIKTARMILDELPDFARKNGGYVRACRELIEAADAREAELERRRIACGYDATAERDEALSKLEREAWKHLIQTPAPDGAALLWKIQELWGCEQDGDYSAAWDMAVVEPVLADARRLLSNGRA